MSEVRDNAVVLVIGKRATGKSFLVRDILHLHRDLPFGTVVSPTECIDGCYRAIVPSALIHDEYSPSLVARVIKRQRREVRRAAAEPDHDPRAFLVLDNCLHGAKWTKDVAPLFLNGRQYKAMLLLTMPYALNIPLLLRANIDHVFILRENLVSNRKRIYELYADIFPTFDMFCQVMDACTEGFECLVINLCARSNRLEDHVFWYKAQQHPADFPCGSEAYLPRDVHVTGAVRGAEE